MMTGILSLSRMSSLVSPRHFTTGITRFVSPYDSPTPSASGQGQDEIAQNDIQHSLNPGFSRAE
jgi:hypothetical protein